MDGGALGYNERGRETGRWIRSEVLDMTSEIIFEVNESAEGGFEARALGHPIFTLGETVDELKEMVQDAVRCHFDEPVRPRIIRLHFVKDEVIAV